MLRRVLCRTKLPRQVPSHGTPSSGKQRRWVQVQDEPTGKSLWWNPATGEKTPVGAPKPKDEEAEHFTRSLWGSFVWAGVMGVLFTGLFRLFGG